MDHPTQFIIDAIIFGRMNQDDMNNLTPKIPSKVWEGIWFFNQRNFYAAHEFFEDAWRETPDHSREFYRALLHISGGFFRLTQGKSGAAMKFFEHAARWLSEFEPDYLGFDLTGLQRLLQKMNQEIEDHTQPEQLVNQYSKLIFPHDHEEIS